MIRIFLGKAKQGRENSLGMASEEFQGLRATVWAPVA